MASEKKKFIVEFARISFGIAASERAVESEDGKAAAEIAVEQFLENPEGDVLIECNVYDQHDELVWTGEI